jgi:hypothetical protein
MDYFFIRDYQNKYRFFTSEPIHPIEKEFSRLKKMWVAAKQKFLLLPKKTLAQEQAFEKALDQNQKIEILHSGYLDEKKIKKRFFYFLQKQRTKHIFLLIGETLLLPLSGLMAFLPGPNVFFGVLALIMYTHWQSLRGINKISKLGYVFSAAEPFFDWEEKINSDSGMDLDKILAKIEKEYNIKNIKKILWK